MKADPYWQKEGAKKTFTHPWPDDWLVGVDRRTRVLDFGCGYGRLTPVLLAAGFRSIDGYDPSPELVARAGRENPAANYTTRLEDLRDFSYGLVVCFAVFNCMPRTEAQEEAVRFIDSATGPGAALCLSDYLMDDNAAYGERYAQRLGGIHGCFRSGEATFRHHERGHFERLLAAWTKEHERPVPGRTMNGTPVVIRQWFFRKAPAVHGE